ncbi:sodium/potassium-transporting ATPase subunit beta-2b [Clupea harengus]|uniref:Sodium/potassium-transporting ATPase subunit beta n=1 Tax=Clupea harengus TaxID=7950 RepID=A0A6P8FPR0_CLUHA|nr:sodium/potassium-transporting ATPase subunit beta-2b [Clupea harengus]
MAKDDGKVTWKESIWNPRTGEFIGRTASSWGLIILFYVAFYIFLAAFFCLTMYALLMTLEDNRPKHQDRLVVPGLMMRPRSGNPFLEIDYMMEETESWDMYVQALDEFLSPYNDSEQAKKNYECVSDKYFFQSDSGSVKNYPKRSCQFHRSILGECSGLTDRTYGYGDGQPCIIVKLNRVIGMLPGGKDGEPPFVTCAPKIYGVSEDDTETTEDTDKMGQVMYFPPNGTFNLMYYPYYGKKEQVNYSQPLVAIKFLNLTTNTDINVECKVTAPGINAVNVKDKFGLKVVFRLRVNSRN